MFPAGLKLSVAADVRREKQLHGSATLMVRGCGVCVSMEERNNGG
jgi:hypothetical protein